jgi:hypothetical protein
MAKKRPFIFGNGTWKKRASLRIGPIEEKGSVSMTQAVSDLEGP